MKPSKQFGVVLFDTNIIDYAFKSATKQAAIDVIELVAKSYETAVSEYVRFEIYRGLEHARVPLAKAVVDRFRAFPVDKYTLDIAAALSTCYRRDDAVKHKAKSISDGDTILAATAVINKCNILTADRMDFPTPYFNEIDSFKQTTQKGPLVFYVLQPDILHLNEMLTLCYPVKSEG